MTHKGTAHTDRSSSTATGYDSTPTNKPCIKCIYVKDETEPKHGFRLYTCVHDAPANMEDCESLQTIINSWETSLTKHLTRLQTQRTEMTCLRKAGEDIRDFLKKQLKEVGLADQIDVGICGSRGIVNEPFPSFNQHGMASGKHGTSVHSILCMESSRGEGSPELPWEQKRRRVKPVDKSAYAARPGTEGSTPRLLGFGLWPEVNEPNDIYLHRVNSKTIAVCMPESLVTPPLGSSIPMSITDFETDTILDLTDPHCHEWFSRWLNQAVTDTRTAGKNCGYNYVDPDTLKGKQVWKNNRDVRPLVHLEYTSHDDGTRQLEIKAMDKASKSRRLAASILLSTESETFVLNGDTDHPLPLHELTLERVLPRDGMRQLIFPIQTDEDDDEPSTSDESQDQGSAAMSTESDVSDR